MKAQKCIKLSNTKHAYYDDEMAYEFCFPMIYINFQRELLLHVDMANSWASIKYKPCFHPQRQKLYINRNLSHVFALSHACSTRVQIT